MNRINRQAKWWILLILLVAAGLRLWALPDLPPGLTHDEADHGLDAWGVVNGVRPLYFTVGYGREPLFDYSTAVLMLFLGRSYLAGRLTAVFYGMVLVAGSYAWTRRAFNRSLALLTSAGLATSFWAVMTARQALRSVTMPALFLLVVIFYWEGLRQQKRWLFLVSGFWLGLTFYTYLPARLIWLLFPALLLYWFIFQRDQLRRYGRETGLMLAVAGIVALPLFWFLYTHPTAEARLDQLSGPLSQAMAGEFAPLWQNIQASWQLFTQQGDSLWRYNLPGKPWLDTVLGSFFYLGLLITGWRLMTNKGQIGERNGLVFAWGWLLLGMMPAFITGPEASTTRAIAIQPILYLFPAIGLSLFYSAWTTWYPRLQPIAGFVACLLFAGTTYTTIQAYFQQWATHPQVRVQYETTLVEAVNYLNQHSAGKVAISTAAPDRFHNPSVGLLYLQNPAISLHWFNGASSLLLPHADSTQIIFSGFAQLHPALSPYFVSTSKPLVLSLPESDLNRPLTLYTLDPPQLLRQWQESFTLQSADFSSILTLHGYKLLTPHPAPAQTIQLISWWQVRQPMEKLVLFTHLVGADGLPLAQTDRLDVPSYYWQTGDSFLQLHEFALPADLPAGSYTLRIGVYSCLDTLCRQTNRLSVSTAKDYVELEESVIINR